MATARSNSTIKASVSRINSSEAAAALTSRLAWMICHGRMDRTPWQHIAVAALLLVQPIESGFPYRGVLLRGIHDGRLAETDSRRQPSSLSDFHGMGDNFRSQAIVSIEGESNESFCSG